MPADGERPQITALRLLRALFLGIQTDRCNANSFRGFIEIMHSPAKFGEMARIAFLAEISSQMYAHAGKEIRWLFPFRIIRK